MARYAKEYVFRQHWKIALVACAVGIAAVMLFVERERGTLIIGIVAWGLGFSYFALTQRLQELRLFHQLFTDFNKRYDKMNEKLSDIRSAERLSAEDKKKLVDYFNLCAEEFLWFEEGYLPPAVWRSWCRGMRSYITKPHIRALWNREVEADRRDYYDMTGDEIEAGASCEAPRGLLARLGGGIRRRIGAREVAVWGTAAVLCTLAVLYQPMHFWINVPISTEQKQPTVQRKLGQSAEQGESKRQTERGGNGPLEALLRAVEGEQEVARQTRVVRVRRYTWVTNAPRMIETKHGPRFAWRYSTDVTLLVVELIGILSAAFAAHWFLTRAAKRKTRAPESDPLVSWQE